jgi:hypothetical protein
MTEKQIRFFDLFGGIGGFRLGLERASNRYRCVGYRSNPDSSQTSICSAEDFLARLSASPETVKDLKTPGELSFLKSAGLPEPKDPRFYSSKMLRDCSATTKEKLSEQSSRPWMNWGMMRSGKSLTANTGESRKTVKESSLSQVLENDPADKYFLSQEKTEKILEKMDKRTS